MPIVNNLTQLYPISFATGKAPLEEGLGRATATITSATYNSTSRLLVLNLSDGRTVSYQDIPSLDWLQVKFLGGL